MTDTVYCPPNVDCPCYAALTVENEKLRAENERLLEDLDTWKSVFPDIAPDRVLPDRSLLEAENERLRSALDRLYWYAERLKKRDPLLIEAADELERLRSEVQTWISHTKTAVWSDSEECKFLTEENAKLRAALGSIMELEGEINPMNYDADDVSKLNNAFIESYHIARAALEGKP